MRSPEIGDLVRRGSGGLALVMRFTYSYCPGWRIIGVIDMKGIRSDAYAHNLRHLDEETRP